MYVATRGGVRGRLADEDHVTEYENVGPGLVVCYKPTGTRQTFTNLLEEVGWYVASIADTEDELILMPVPEGL